MTPFDEKVKQHVEQRESCSAEQLARAQKLLARFREQGGDADLAAVLVEMGLIDAREAQLMRTLYGGGASGDDATQTMKGWGPDSGDEDGDEGEGPDPGEMTGNWSDEPSHEDVRVTVHATEEDVEGPDAGEMSGEMTGAWQPESTDQVEVSVHTAEVGGGNVGPVDDLDPPALADDATAQLDQAELREAMGLPARQAPEAPPAAAPDAPTMKFVATGPGSRGRDPEATAMTSEIPPADAPPAKPRFMGRAEPAFKFGAATTGKDDPDRTRPEPPGGARSGTVHPPAFDDDRTLREDELSVLEEPEFLDLDKTLVEDDGVTPLPPPPPSAPKRFGDDLEGTELGGCLLNKELGRGAMGVVFDAIQIKLQRRAAMKILLPHAGRRPEDVELFVKEARALGKIEHPNIVQVYDVGTQGDLHYIVMQFVDGQSVEELLEAQGGQLDDWEEAIRIGREAARGLAVAHEKGIVHRDVKPANLMLTSEGEVKVADFGIAAQAKTSEDDDSHHDIMGTPAYMSPEQVDGRRCDGRADIYSLGCTLYTLLAGRHPFTGKNVVEIMLKHTKETAPPLHKVVPKLPLSISRLVEKCMAKTTDARYASAHEIVADIDEILSGGKPKIVIEIEDVMGRMEQILEDYSREPSIFTRPAVVVGMAVGVVVALGAGLWFALPPVDIPEEKLVGLQPPPIKVDTAGIQADAAAKDVDVRIYENPADLEGNLQAIKALAQVHAGELGPELRALRERAKKAHHDNTIESYGLIEETTKRLLQESKPLEAAAELFSFPAEYRSSKSDITGRWTQQYLDVRRAVTRATQMAFIPGDTIRLGRDDVPTKVKPILVDVTEVSNGEYARFVEETGARPPAHWRGPKPNPLALKYPVIGVTAAEADAFAKWADKRLPTSAEWEAAARAFGTRYPWGDRFDARLCAARTTVDADLVHVDRLPNGRSMAGIFNLAGNAAEWTASDVDDPWVGKGRIVRGGSYRSHPANCTTKSIYAVPPDTSEPSMLIGFRCVKDIEL